MKIAPCDSCPLRDNPELVCVSGEWRGEHRIPVCGTQVMVLGMNPGWTEAKDGRPFVGPSGRLLADALAKAGVTDYYITNAIKCACDNPTKAQLKACRSKLEEEIAEVKPRYILACGNIAVQSVLGKGTIGRLAGKEIWTDKYNCWILPAWHPAYLLRSPGKEKSWRLDLHRFGGLVRGRAPNERPDIEVFWLSEDGWRTVSLGGGNS